MTYDYHEPETLAEALDLMARHGEDAHLVAGATAFTLLWRQGLLRPGHVIGLRRIAGLGGITATDKELVIGATATHREIERSADVARHCPALTRTFASVATVRIRNQATLGGNLAHADPAQDPPPMLMALGACGPTPVRARSVEDALAGAVPDAARIADAAARVDADIAPFDDVRGSAGYKRDMARVWTERALVSLVEGRA